MKSNRRKGGLHPIWRGIGCIMIIIVPLMSYALAVLVTPSIKATGILPRELFLHLHFPVWAYQTPVISPIAVFLSSLDNLGAIILFFFIFLVILSGIFSMIYAGIYQTIGPARYTALDAPPTKFSGKRYKR